MTGPLVHSAAAALTGRQRALLAVLWLSLVCSLLVGIFLWLRDQQWWNETVVTSTLEYGRITMNGQPAPIEWIDRYPRHRELWQFLLLAWFYPAKILLRVRVTSSRWQLLGYSGLALAATVWVWGRLVTWDWWMCETVYSKVIGQPMFYLFVPSAFFLYDWASGPRRGPGMLLPRMVLELLLIVPWVFVWAIFQLMIGWLWI